MRNFQGTYQIPKRSFISPFSICITVPLSIYLLSNREFDLFFIYIWLIKFLFYLIFIYLEIINWIYLKDTKAFFSHLFHLSMPTDNATWQARSGIFYALKPLQKSKSSTKNVLSIFLTISFPIYLYFTLIMFLAFPVLYWPKYQHWTWEW